MLKQSHDNVIIEKFSCLIGKEGKIVSVSNFQDCKVNIMSIRLKLLDFNNKELSKFTILRLTKMRVDRNPEHVVSTFYNDIVNHGYKFREPLLLNNNEKLCLYTVSEKNLPDKYLPDINIDKSKSVVEIEFENS
jgi:hypothetical protein